MKYEFEEEEEGILTVRDFGGDVQCEVNIDDFGHRDHAERTAQKICDALENYGSHASVDQTANPES